ncbi:MAG: MATE family efflux transporter [Candidatus Marinimicrobia bacterium]|nr:MATE family efflux transporter [Candidatus Neomarinimicrobiota bacterium]
MSAHTIKSRRDTFMANPHKALWTLSVPVMVGMIVQTVYSIADMIFIGRISPEAIAAMAFNVPLIFFSIGITFGLGSGVTALIARFIGADDKRQAENTAEHGIILGGGIGIVFTIAGLIFGDAILSGIGCPPELMADATGYFRIIAMGFVFTIAAVFLRSIFTGEGDTKTPMIFQAIGTVVNIILDPLFIFTLDMGVKGAALATILSQFLVSLALIYTMLVQKKSYLQFHFRVFQFNRYIIKEVLRIGVPASLSMIIMSSGAALFNFILVYYSPSAVAAFQVATRLDQLYFLPILSIGGGMVTLVGMFYGAKRLDLIYDIIKYGLTRSIIIGVVCGILFFIIAPYVFPVFSPDKEIQDIATQYIRVMAFVYPLISVGMISGRSMQGLGAGMPQLMITAIRVALVSGPLAYIFTFFMDKPMIWVWYALAISVVAAAGTGSLWLRHQLHRTREKIAVATETPKTSGDLTPQPGR